MASPRVAMLVKKPTLSGGKINFFFGTGNGTISQQTCAGRLYPNVHDRSIMSVC